MPLAANQLCHCGADTVRPFDFLVGGELVRQTLEELLLAKDLSAVRLAVIIKYFIGIQTLVFCPCLGPCLGCLASGALIQSAGSACLRCTSQMAQRGGESAPVLVPTPAVLRRSLSV